MCGDSTGVGKTRQLVGCVANELLKRPDCRYKVVFLSVNGLVDDLRAEVTRTGLGKSVSALRRITDASTVKKGDRMPSSGSLFVSYSLLSSRGERPVDEFLGDSSRVIFVM